MIQNKYLREYYKNNPELFKKRSRECMARLRAKNPDYGRINSAKQRAEGGETFRQNKIKYNKQYKERRRIFAEQYAKSNKLKFDKILKQHTELYKLVQSTNNLHPYNQDIILKRKILEILTPIIIQMPNTLESKYYIDRKFSKSYANDIILAYIELIKQ